MSFSQIRLPFLSFKPVHWQMVDASTTQRQKNPNYPLRRNNNFRCPFSCKMGMTDILPPIRHYQSAFRGINIYLPSFFLSFIFFSSSLISFRSQSILTSRPHINMVDNASKTPISTHPHFPLSTTSRHTLLFVHIHRDCTTCFLCNFSLAYK